MIVTEKITRSAQTIFFNFLMDSEMFGTTAADPDFSILHPAGRRSKSAAFNDLFAVSRGEEPSERFLLITRLGGVDDTIIGNTIEPNLQRTLRDVLFGEVGRMKHLGNESVQFLKGILGEDASTAKALDWMIGGSDDPQVLALRKRWTQLDNDLKTNEVLTPKETAELTDAKLAIEALLEKQSASAGNSIRRGFQALNHLIIGDGKTGLFKDHESVFRTFYGNISNVNRVGAIYHLMDKGVSPEEAIRRVNLFMQHYSAVPEFIKGLGSHPLGSPVVSFPYEMIRIGKNMLRYAPERLLGYMGGFSAANFMSMVAGGLDPYKVYEQHQADSAGFPGWLSFASSLDIPHADGTMSTLQVPALNWWQPGREPFGVQAKMFGMDDTPGLSWQEVLTNVSSKFFLGNPVTTTIYAKWTGRDPKTGQILSETDNFLGRAASHLGELMVPPEVPFLGSIARDIAEGMEKPRYVRSGREIAPAQRGLQATLGVRMRGWLGTEGPLAAIGETLAKGLGVEAWTDIPLRRKPGRGFDDREVRAQLFVASRRVNPKSGPNERILDQPFNDLRKAHELLQEDDPKSREVGAKLRDKALKDFEEALQPFSDFHGRQIERKRTQQEIDQLVTRAYTTQDFTVQFDKLPIDRKVFILIGMEMTELNDKDTSAFILRTMLQDGIELRTYSSTADIQNAVSQLDSHLANPPKTAHLKELQQLRGVLAAIEQEALIEHSIQMQTDAIMRNAADIFFGENTK
jgi:hypothetical protein